LDIIHDVQTKKSFNVGGGKGDGDRSTPRGVHPPLKMLTEVTGLAHTNVTGPNLRPKEHMHDGNKCEDTEELYAGLCYQKCSILTDGDYTLRSTAFSCCKSEPCTALNSKIADTTPCGGYDVNKDGGCPHSPGACLENEEMFLDMCYEKCSLLTHGKYPYRGSSFTCCKEEDVIDCLNPLHLMRGDEAVSSFNYATSGGNDDNDPATPGGVHGPLKFLTETA
jgi:hypothetical protein